VKNLRKQICGQCQLTNVCAKFRCTPLYIKKEFLDPGELIPTRTTRVAFWDPPSGSKNAVLVSKSLVLVLKSMVLFLVLVSHSWSWQYVADDVVHPTLVLNLRFHHQELIHIMNKCYSKLTG